MALRVIIDDAIVQTRAVVLDGHQIVRIALTGLGEGPAAGTILPARISSRLGGHEDCLVEFDDGSEGHLSGRRGGSDKTLTQGKRFMAEVVRAGDIDKRPEVRKAPDGAAATPNWDDVDQCLATLPARFSGPITVATPQIWNARVPAWKERFPALSGHFQQDFQAPGQLFSDCGADDALLALMAQDWPLKGGGNIRYGTVSAITVFDINSGGPSGQKGALNTNMAAAQALPQLIAIGGFGGLMVADFIDLKRQSDQKKVLDAFDAHCRALGLSMKRTGWSKFGLVEMQAPRTASHLSAQLLSDDGAGYHAPRIALLALSKALESKPAPVVLRTSNPVFRWLTRNDGAQALSQRLALPISIEEAADDWPSGAWLLEEQ